MSPDNNGTSLRSLADLLGPVTHDPRPQVVFSATTHATHPNVSQLTLSATADIDLPQTAYHDPQVHVQLDPASAALASRLHFLGFQSSEFALPVRAPDTKLSFSLFSRPDFYRPPVILPLFVLARPEGDESAQTDASPPSELALLAPLDAFHEQVLAVHDGALRWGWSGDLTGVSAGFATSLAIIREQSPNRALQTWATLLAARAPVARPMPAPPARYANDALARVSYWTDNGAAYWYRREPGRSVPDSIVAAVDALEKGGVPVSCVELDSWFYPHEKSRPVTDVGYLSVVPPTGLLLWEPRPDTLGGDAGTDAAEQDKAGKAPGGVYELRNRLNGRGLILHSRHIAAASPYVRDETLGKWWVDNDRAHPQSDLLWRRLLRQAADWGAVVYEQDWLSELWLGVRALRERPGRIAAWQTGVDAAARENGVALLWCMATPADMALAATALPAVCAVRGCDDYRYADDPSTLWRWQLTTSAMLCALGLAPFKDVFLSGDNGRDAVDIDGDPNARVEACLAALSAGPVGVGDRVGHADASVIRACCRDDGVLVKPDLPIVALDRSLRDTERKRLLWGATRSGPWRYIFAVRTGVKSGGDAEWLQTPLEESLALHEVAREVGEPDSASVDTVAGAETLLYDWRDGSASVQSACTAALRIHEWRLWVACPVVRAGGDAFALIGDGSLYACMGDRRVRVVGPAGGDAVLFEVLGRAGESVEVSYWSEVGGGVQRERVVVGGRGWTRLRVGVAGGASRASVQTVLQ